ncbi:aminodeoxychorismate/anthranilate synthase component II, partial [Campylobacter coli]
HQCIGEIFGGKITPMPYPMQGKISRLHLKKNAKKSLLFKGIKNKSKICLYHSLHISKMPKSCEILALNDKNIIMAIKHKKYEIYGVQFHPEAILSQNGKKLLKNFMKI